MSRINLMSFFNVNQTGHGSEGLKGLYQRISRRFATRYSVALREKKRLASRVIDCTVSMETEKGKDLYFNV